MTNIPNFVIFVPFVVNTALANLTSANVVAWPLRFEQYDRVSNRNLIAQPN